MPLSTHGVTGINGGKGKYLLNTSPKKSFTRSVRQINILQTPCRRCCRESLSRQEDETAGTVKSLTKIKVRRARLDFSREVLTWTSRARSHWRLSMCEKSERAGRVLIYAAYGVIGTADFQLP